MARWRYERARLAFRTSARDDGTQQSGGLSYLARFGIGLEALDNVGMVGVLPIQVIGTYFDLAEDGRAAFVIPVANALPPFSDWPDSPSPVFDALAFFPDKPDHWFLRIGHALVLGGVNLRVARSPYAIDPLRVFRTPLSWLQAGCDGATARGIPMDLGAGTGEPTGAGHLASDSPFGR